MTALVDPPASMPGSFLSLGDQQFQSARFKASPFLPPHDEASPSSSFTPRQQQHQPISTSTISTSRDSARYSRKRLRLHADNNQDESSVTFTSSGFDAPSPAPLVNTKYRIAGGLDSAAALDQQSQEDAHEFDYEVDCRPNRYTQQQPFAAEPRSYFPQTPASEEERVNNKRRLSGSQPGWGKAVWALTGGFAGKVINFCWNSTFKGFHAGGGNGYRFDIGTPDVTASSVWTQVETQGDVFHNGYSIPPSRRQRESTPIPGGFPDDELEFKEDYMSTLSASNTTGAFSTPTKNTQDNESPSTLRNNSWVMLEAPGNTSRDTSPVRKKSRASTANLHASRPSVGSRHSSSHLPRPRMPSRASSGRPSASYASPRTSVVAQANTVLHHHQHSRHSLSSFSATADSQAGEFERSAPAGTPRPVSTANRVSMASPRRPSSAVAQQPSPEVRKFEQKMRRKEAKQDVKMNRANDQLQAMIREAQAALGSKVEVEGDDIDVEVDEGYFEDAPGLSRNRGKREAWEKDYVRPSVWS